MAIRIRTKIVVGFASLLVLISILGAINNYSRTLLVASVMGLEKGGYELETFTDLKFALEQVVMPPNDYLITGDVKEKEAFARLAGKVETGFRELGEMKHHGNHEDFYRKALDKFVVLKSKGEAILALNNPVGDARGARWMKEMDALAREIVETDLDNAYQGVKEEIKEGVIASELARRKVETLQWTGMIAAFLVAVFFILYLNRSILRPITVFQEGAHIVGNGNLDHRIRIRDGTEINLLVEEFNRMTQKLKEAQADLEKKVEERTRELQDLNKRLETLSITDGLTGLYNHRYFYDRLTEEFLRARRYNRPLALIMIDIDYFKQYNDAHGHPQGDRVLREAAARLQESTRGQDVAARYGGEEFAVLLPEIDKTGAASLAQRIRFRISEHVFPHEETQPGGNLTVSLGVAAFPGDAETPETLIQRADDALYRAKSGGKNRVEIA